MSTPLNAFWRALADRYSPSGEIGSGRQATVWRARDLRHGRDVAVKILSPELTAVLGVDRFLQEIEVTARLQHPHVVALFDSGEAEGLLYYVMPFLDGESLRARLTREGLLPVDDAVRISVEVAEGLEYAHRQGFVHRDVKPENILLHDGRALVTDFGIALATEAAGEERMTQTGFSPGTPHYMSPEQAGGAHTLDRRSDVYSLACVTYEMLAGRPPFVASMPQTVVSKVMTEDPEPVGVHRRSVPAHLERALEVALEKLPADRFQSMSDYAAALEGEEPTGRWGLGARRRSSRPGRSAVGVASIGALGAAVGVAAMVLLAGGPPDAGETIRFTVPTAVPLVGGGGRPLAVSGDGRCLAYTSDQRLFLHCLDAFEATEVALPEAAYNPVFSPDGQWLAFQNDAVSAFKVRVSGGPPVKICDCGWGGAAWTTDDEIVYSSWGSGGLWSIAAEGGEPRRLTTADRRAGEVNHAWPAALPGGRIAFTVEGEDGTRLAVTDGRGGWREVHPEGVLIGYLPPGHLIYGRYDRVWALPFDAQRGEARGEPFPVFALPTGAGYVPAAVSEAGTLAYVPAPAESHEELVVLAPDGTVTPVVEGPTFKRPRVSPDGSRIVYSGGDGEALDLWVFDRRRGTSTRLTFDGNNIAPVWTPDGREVAFARRIPGSGDPYQLFRVRADGGSTPRPLATSDRSWYPHAWSPDGTRLALYDEDPARTDVLLLTVDGGDAEVVAGGPGDQYAPALSPDGELMAYVSTESGVREVFLRSLRDDVRWTVSGRGGESPVWAGDGRTLYFRSGGRMMSASVPADGDRTPGPPERLLDLPFTIGNLGGRGREYDILPDGSFLFSRSAGGGARRIHVVTGWSRELAPPARPR